MKKPTIKSLQAELKKRNEELREQIEKKESERSLRYAAEKTQLEIERSSREERAKLNNEIDNLREQLRASDQAGSAYTNKVLIYFMALANPEISKDAEHMKRLMADVVRPYSSLSGIDSMWPRDCARGDRP